MTHTGHTYTHTGHTYTYTHTGHTYTYTHTGHTLYTYIHRPYIHISYRPYIHDRHAYMYGLYVYVWSVWCVLIK